MSTTLANTIFTQPLASAAELESKYPLRSLPEGAAVTRFAPSPTGFMHIGNVLGAFVDRLLADQTDGVLYLRLEDTDKKREVADGAAAILSGLNALEISLDEGVDGGAYAPYTQSQRREIYHAFAKQLVEDGLAYPCFCTSEQLEHMRDEQDTAGVNKGYYGQWAKCRCMPEAEQLRRLQAGESYTLRLRSPGDAARKIIVQDMIRGKLELPEYDMDVVLLKADGIPTYHFAHVVDDHLMRTSHVVRGDEWLATLPLHVQLFGLLRFKPPKYAHIAPLMKIDSETGGKRKLSKRKDPEAAVSFFTAQGYPAAALREYLLTLLNSNFEEWRRANPTEDLAKFPFSLKKMSSSGALFDLQKLDDVSKTVISRMTAEEVYAQALAWASEYDAELAALLARDADFATAMFAIDRGGKKPRKDIARWSQVREAYAYFYDCFHENLYSSSGAGWGYGYSDGSGDGSGNDWLKILKNYSEVYSAKDDKETWFEKIKSICEPLGFCSDVKSYKAEPDKWKGHVGDVSSVIRMMVTGRENSPDLWAVMQVLGEDEVLRRLKG
ncbi:MAG: glutamate--tRNA ligase [Oscillospiraceae bacterium]|nr:glutamate--tRNA ligase [Oscillospiraceae bacterium]